MTGIQALERISEELPISEEKPVAIEFEYKRHGTQTLIAGFNVTTGQTYGICGDTRKEDDFSSFIELSIKNNPNYKKYRSFSHNFNQALSKPSPLT